MFAAQRLFYDMHPSATTVILSTISIGLFGYGLCGVLRPICVWHVDAVYWSTLPTVKTLQGLHWEELKNSKPLRYFWYAFVSMFLYEFLPAYIWPWLNSVSIPCLASMNATGETASNLVNFFGGAVNNEGLGLFSFSFDWQYVTSFNTSLPLKLQANSAAGYFVCYIAMIAIYYSNAWGSKALPFMSTSLRMADGSKYPTAKVFVNGVLDKAALAEYGLPRLTGTFAYSLLMANAAIGALVLHCFLFWGGDIWRAYKGARKGSYSDKHHCKCFRCQMSQACLTNVANSLHGRELQGSALVLVCRSPGSQLRPRPGSRPQRRRHPAGLGLRRLPHSWQRDRSIGMF